MNSRSGTSRPAWIWLGLIAAGAVASCSKRPVRHAPAPVATPAPRVDAGAVHGHRLPAARSAKLVAALHGEGPYIFRLEDTKQAATETWAVWRNHAPFPLGAGLPAPRRWVAGPDYLDLAFRGTLIETFRVRRDGTMARALVGPGVPLPDSFVILDLATAAGRTILHIDSSELRLARTWTTTTATSWVPVDLEPALPGASIGGQLFSVQTLPGPVTLRPLLPDTAPVIVGRQLRLPMAWAGCHLGNDDWVFSIDDNRLWARPVGAAPGANGWLEGDPGRWHLGDSVETRCEGNAGAVASLGGLDRSGRALFTTDAGATWRRVEMPAGDTESDDAVFGTPTELSITRRDFTDLTWQVVRVTAAGATRRRAASITPPQVSAHLLTPSASGNGWELLLVAPDGEVKFLPATLSPPVSPAVKQRLSLMFTSGGAKGTAGTTSELQKWLGGLPEPVRGDLARGRLFFVATAPWGLPSTGPARKLFDQRATWIASVLEDRGGAPLHRDPRGQFAALDRSASTADTVEFVITDRKPLELD